MHIQSVRKFKIIYADPPWAYRNQVFRKERKNKYAGSAEYHYPVMTVEEIKKLQVRGCSINDMSDNNSILFMWATFPNLPEALEVIKAWGFKYKTVGFTWIKTNKINGKPFFGLGHYTKSNAEICLIAIKGRPKIICNTISSIVMTPREGHSKKPDVVREKIVELCGKLPRIELFARQQTRGWIAWGNQV